MEYRATCPSSDGTTKYVFDLPVKGIHKSYKDKVSIESAFIHIEGRDVNKPEYILCLSSQAGCPYRCNMCANMFDSFYGCLTPDEINEQIKLTLEQDNNLKKIKARDSVEYAFMAMGEPLYGTNVIQAIQKHKPFVKNTKFALSTVGAKGTIDRLTKATLPFPTRLELSLHFPTDELRREWLQADYLFFKERPELNISSMLDEAERFLEKHPGKVTLNYTLIDGVNNMENNLDEIVELLKGREGFYVKVMSPNLTSSLVYSRIGPKGKRFNVGSFSSALKELGVESTTFESKGRDAFAGCGMMTTQFRGSKGLVDPKELVIPEADFNRLGLD